MDQPQDVTFMLIDRFSPLALSCAVAPLQLANRLSGRPLYRWHLAAANSTMATGSNGYALMVDRGLDPTPAGGMLLVLSGSKVDRLATSQHVNYLRREDRRGTRIGALCSGAYVLARAGLLDGVRSAVSPFLHDTFDAFFPEVPLTADSFVADERYYSSCNAKASLDLMLAHIRARDGTALSGNVAEHIVAKGVESVTTGQISYLLDRGANRNGHVAEAIRIMATLGPEVPAASEIAARLGISQRQLERLFRENLNRSPKNYLAYIRLSKARQMLDHSERTVSEIGRACGFRSASHFSRSYRRAFGMTPNEQRTGGGRG